MPNLMDYRISVVIPCFKHARFLPATIESVVNQTVPVHEIIVVNDGSPDDTREVTWAQIRRFPYHRITLLDKPNGGLSDARNAGIAAAQGEWILPLDADDLFEPTFVAKALAGLRSDPHYNLAHATCSSFGAVTGLWRPADYSLSLLATQNLFPYSSIFPKELWARAGGYDRSLPWSGEDYSFWMSCGELGLKPFRVDEPLFLYRRHQEGSMFTELMKRWATVEAMIRTTHHALYSGPALLEAHDRIARMEDETLHKLDEKQRRFDDLAFPNFWRGLRLALHNHHEAALTEFRRFQRLHFRPDWQPLWHMLKSNHSLGRTVDAQRNREELATLFPRHDWVDEAIRRLNADRPLPTTLRE